MDLVMSIPFAALVGIGLGMGCREYSPGQRAIAIGAVNLGLWLAIGAMVQFMHPASAPAQPARGKVPQLMQEGWRLWQSQQADAAAVRFQEVIQIAPTNADAWNGLGWSEFNSGKIADAEKSFQQAISLDPNHPAALNGLGQIYLSEGKYNDAERYLLKAAPRAPAAWYGLARLYLLQGNYAQAERWAQNIIDSGQADETIQKILQAAKDKHLSEGLRLMIEPPETATEPQPDTSATQATPRRSREWGLLAARMELDDYQADIYWNLSVSTNQNCQLFNRDYPGPSRIAILLCYDSADRLQVTWSWDKKPEADIQKTAEAEVKNLQKDIIEFFRLVQSDRPIPFTPFARNSPSQTPDRVDYTNALSLINSIESQSCAFHVALKKRDVKLAQNVIPVIAAEFHNYNRLMQGTPLEIQGQDSKSIDQIVAAVQAGDMDKVQALNDASGDSEKPTDLNDVKAQLKKAMEN
jgi:tetratricopeptide (TPR) repeat protein